jgi:hypothetical protein
MGVYELLRVIDRIIRVPLEIGSIPAAPIDLARVATGSATVLEYPRPSFDQRMEMYGEMKGQGVKVGHTHHIPGHEDEIMIMPR